MRNVSLNLDTYGVGINLDMYGMMSFKTCTHRNFTLTCQQRGRGGGGGSET